METMLFEIASLDIGYDALLAEVKPFELEYDIISDWTRDNSHDAEYRVDPTAGVATDMLLKHIGRDEQGLWTALLKEVNRRYREEIDNQLRRVL